MKATITYSFIAILAIIITAYDYPPLASNAPLPVNKVLSPHDTLILTDGFDFPVGKPDAKGYYNAQKFMENKHLGEDWNGINGGNTDLGDPIFAIANAYVSVAKDLGGGWGNVIRLIHYLPNGQSVESVYAHCDTMNIRSGTWVSKGEIIGTIGNANGQYKAHLHFEIRSKLNLPIGPGYSSDTTGYLNPSQFINTHRN